MHDSVILSKLFLALAGAVACVAIWRLAAIRRISKGQFGLMALALAVLSREGFYVLIYVIQRQPVPHDVPEYYCPEAMHVLAGMIPYRDFMTSYAPLFDYVGAALLSVWRDPRVFVVVAMALDLLSLPLWLAVGRRLFSENVVRTATVLYLTNVKVLLCIGTGQNQIWIAFLLAASLWLQMRGRPFWSGMMLGLGLSAVKLLVLILTPPVWLAGRRRIAWMIGFAALPLAVYLGFIAKGADVFRPIKFEAKLVTCGNLPFLATLSGCDAAGAVGVAGVVTLLALWAVFYGVAWKRGLDLDTPRVIHLLTLVLISFMLLSKKAYTGYLVLGMFCLCLTVADRPFGWREMLIYCLFNVVAVMEPTLWERWLPLQDLRLFWQPLHAGHPGYARLALFTLVECALIGCYLHYGIQALRGVWDRRTAATGMNLPPASMLPDAADSDRLVTVHEQM